MKTGKMKGSSTLIILAIGLVIILMIIVSMLNIPLLKSANQVEKNLKARSEIHTMSNALDAAKLYMETSLEYSIYQACYDNLRNGGWDPLPANNIPNKYRGYAVWDFPDTPPDDLKFQRELESSIATNLNLYRGTQAYTFLSDYHVNLPNYPSDDVHVSLEPSDPKWMFVTAWGDSNLNIQKTQESGEYIRLEKDSMLQNEDEHRIDCYGIYRKGLEVYSSARDDMQIYLESLSGDVTQEGVKQGLKEAITSGWGSEDSCSWTENEEYRVSAQMLDIALTKAKTEINENGVTKNSYSVNVKIKFEIESVSGNQFPVYNPDEKVVSFAPMKLVFVLSLKQDVPKDKNAYLRVTSAANKPTTKLSMSSYSYQASDGEDEEETPMCTIAGYDSDGVKTDEVELPDDDPDEKCGYIIADLKAAGWNVIEENEIATSFSGLSFAGSPKYVPPKGTEYLQKIAVREADSMELLKPLLFAVIQQESRWDPYATSPAGAMGLMQLIPSTAGDMGWEESQGSLYDPAINAKYGTKYLKYLLNRFKDEELAIAAYNSGPTRISNFLKSEDYCKGDPTYNCVRAYVPVETVIYVPEVLLRYKKIYSMVNIPCGDTCSIIPPKTL